MQQSKDLFSISKNKIAYSVVAVFLIIAIGLAAWFFWGDRLVVVTQQSEYAKTEDNLRLNIKSYALQDVCFSSCYPYYIQKKDGTWENYPFAKCDRQEVATECVKAFNLVGRGIDLTNWDNLLLADFHRLALPACIGCKEGDPFRTDKVFYSNEFLIK
ncbi:MAG: hypothetical protein WC397_03345 [Candidatus Paceibacterota bacterium]|jgi:hypothetical protein